MTIGEAGSLVGQRGARLSERRSAAASSSTHSPFKTASPRKIPEVEVLDDVEQGSPEWFELRRGVPTASRFAAVIATSKTDGTQASSLTRGRLLRVLAGEILSGEIAEGFRSEAMGRGTAMEREACEHYERTRLVEVRRVGFVRRKLPSGRWVGCSPDGFVGEKRALEIKTTRPDLLIDVLDNGAAGFPTQHRAQLQGTLWIVESLGITEIDLHMYYRGMRAATFTVYRDDSYIRDLAHSVEVFDWELHRLVERLR